MTDKPDAQLELARDQMARNICAAADANGYDGVLDWLRTNLDPHTASYQPSPCGVEGHLRMHQVVKGTLQIQSGEASDCYACSLCEERKLLRADRERIEREARLAEAKLWNRQDLTDQHWIDQRIAHLGGERTS